MKVEKPAYVTAYLVGFVRFLRDRDFLAGPGETADALRALEKVDLSVEKEVRSALRLVLCSKKSEQDLFDTLFDRFFYSTVQQSKQSSASPGEGEQKKDGARILESGKEESDGHVENLGTTEGEEGVQSRSETKDVPENDASSSFLQAVRFSSMESERSAVVRISPDETEKMVPAARSMISAFQLNRSRRYRPMRKGQRLDFRRTFRKNISAGGLMVEPAWSGHPKREAAFVFLCDGSRSMLPYAETFLPFVSAMVRESNKTEAFLFSTRLRKVTPFLRASRRARVVALTDLGMEWGGGTRIGECLESFVRTYGFRVLTKKTVVFILSDGLETGEVEKLQRAMKRLRRQAGRVIWLNPLSGIAGYKPEAQGMKAALPYVDFFSGAYEAPVLKELARSIGNRRNG
ncbi:MAG TPA: VWA domain-containing protein [Bacillales bacterium]|nr:VWA domain-containing protein [Bacillales bacterium]